MARIETTILSRGDSACSLGRLTLCGRVADGLGLQIDRPFRTYGSYAIILVLRGRGLYRDATGAAERVETGSVMLLLPDLPHAYAPDSGTTWDEIYLVFDGPVFDAWRSSGSLPHPPVMRVEQAAPVEARIVALATGDDPPLAKVCALQSLLAELMLASDQVLPPAAPEWLRRASACLARDLHRSLSFSDLAESVAMPYNTFRKRFRQEMGFSPGAFREQARVREAADLLRFTALTHAAIAERVGYSSEHYLSRRFNEATGVPPRVYRRRSQGLEAPPT